MKYKFVPNTDIYDKKLDGVEFELIMYNGDYYMDGSHFSIPIDKDGRSLSVVAGRQGVFNPIEGKKK
jgi:hypothetical protein